eukprot:CAMPEP_0116023594 /NCGR_PEP_ID=MMETSP0321-20121206/11708_1 /TAXON_ID=163516 /ORGANISM="Leptocylindrus danicus var. danicus, Strain B650" /LENGTH=480 /DNA_ID=CAMNT_0003494951 /DNA_START=197 /DNA_END=1636 /DNA_ORIENTATION=+
MSAADINTDTVRDLDVGMKEGIDDLLIDPADSGSTSLPQMQTQTQTDQDVVTEDERIFMGEINRLIDKYKSEYEQQDNASTSCLPQKRSSSSLTVTNKRHKESTAMNSAVEVEELLKKEEERGVKAGQWADRVRELMKYRDNNGHCNVPQRQSSLGEWVRHQRKAFRNFGTGKASSMTPHRVNILSLIDFVWDASSIRYTSKRQDEDWMQMFEELMEYKEKHGDCRVSSKYKGNRKLDYWVRRQRRVYHDTKQGKTTQMTKERILKLEKIGFVWDASDKTGGTRNDEGWMRMFEELMEYKAKHGDCLVPLNYEGNRKLGMWVFNQRRLYRNMKKAKSTWMTKECILKLEKIGFAWDASDQGRYKRDDEGWMRMLKQLIEYKEKHGDCRVPLNYKVNPKLGRWVQHQRGQYQNKKKGKTRQITDERIYKLEEIGFVWYRGWKKRDDEGWMLMFEQLVEYKEEHGDCLVPRKYEINAKLSNW